MSSLRGRNKVITQENVVDSTTEAMLANSNLTKANKTASKRKATGAPPTREPSSRIKKPSAAAVAAAQTEELASDIIINPKKSKPKTAAKKAPATETEPKEEAVATKDVKKGRGNRLKISNKKQASPTKQEPAKEDEADVEINNEEVQPEKVVKKRGAKKDKPVILTEEIATVNGNGSASVDVEEVEQIPKGKKQKKTSAQNSTKQSKSPINGNDGGDGDGDDTSAQSVETKQKEKKRTASTITKDSKIAKTEKSAKRGARGKKASEVDEDNTDNEEEENDEPVLKKAKKNIIKEKIVKKKQTIKKPTKPSIIKVNKSATNYDNIEFNINNDEWNLKIASWNVAGLRAWIQKGGTEYVEYEKPDIICLQETKCALDDVPDEGKLKGYHPYWLCNPGGYAGVAILSKIMPMNIQYGLGDPEHDAHGRCMTAEYEKFYLVCAYVPNSGRKLVSLPTRLNWNEKFHKFIQNLDSKKPVILCGDLNVSHLEIDLANPKTNKRNAGFTQEERDGMTDLLSLGFVDTFRKLYPDRENAYTFWTYMMNARAKNVGWRLDYFIVSQRFASKVIDNVMRNDVYGSDHCPITLFLKV